MKKTVPIVLIILLAGASGCDDFVKIDPPRTSLTKTTVFDSDATADAAMLGIYYQLKSSAFAGGALGSVSLIASFSSDEQTNYYIDPPVGIEYDQINANWVLPNSSLVFVLWSDLYATLYKVNSILEGINASTEISEPLKKQLEGEARFIRAFCNYYLVNLWGDVPLVLTTDYRTNESMARTSSALVFTQIIEDLVRAQELLPVDYAFASGERVRATRWAASALLARAYLHTQDWSHAELESAAVISNEETYSLVPDLSGVFNVNSTEAILQWWSDRRPQERGTFRFVGTPFVCALRPGFVDAFEDGDLRRSVWTALTADGYYSTQKYTASSNNPPLQYSTVLRLAEQYLIRAEARARQNDLSGALEDINVIRNRAGLGDATAADQDEVLAIVEQERRSELFNEWGHRWLDLKRTGRVDAVLGPLKSQWIPTAALFPIPESEIKNNAALRGAQNPGY